MGCGRGGCAPDVPGAKVGSGGRGCVGRVCAVAYGGGVEGEAVWLLAGARSIAVASGGLP